MPSYRVQVLDRAVSILGVLADADAELGLTELTQRLGLSKSTTHRLLMALEDHRLVYQSPRSGKFRLGGRLFELGAKVGGRAALIEPARGPLAKLVAATGETAHLGVLSDGEVVSIYAVEGPRTLRTPATVGRRSPAHTSSLGKAMLAHLGGGALEELMRLRRLRRFTQRTISDIPALYAELEQVRRRGYALDDEEFEEGLCCIGAPVLDATGQAVAAVSIAGPANRVRGRAANELAAYVMRAAAQTSAALTRSAQSDRRGVPAPSGGARHEGGRRSMNSGRGGSAAAQPSARARGDREPNKSTNKKRS